jgi:CAAX protease family protein
MEKTEDQLAGRQIDQVPWTIQQTIIGTVCTLVPWLFFVFALSGNAGSATHIRPLTPQKDLLNALLTFIISSLIEAAFLIAPLYYANRAARAITTHLGRARRAVDFLGFRSFNPGLAFSWICILIVAIISVDNLYQFVITSLHLQLQTNDQVLLERSAAEPLTTYATLAVAVIVAPFCEEIFFRGFLFMGLQRGLPLGWAVLVSALLFAIAHGDPASAPVLFIIGLALAFLRWRTRSIWPGIMLHMLNNGIGAFTIILSMKGLLKA